MKIVLYISGICGALLVAISILGEIISLNHSGLFLIAGLFLLLIIFFPLMILKNRLQNRKIEKIIASYKNKKIEKVDFKKGENKSRGWSMNDSPYRSRKSGLTWGGGNIHAAGAKRGSRRNFRSS